MSENIQSGAPAPAEASSSESNLESIENQENSAEESVEGAEKASQLSKEEKKEIKKTLKKLKLKVDKGEIEEELPFEIPDSPEAVAYMQRQLQMAKMGGKRAQQYSELENEVRSFVELLRSNPKKALSDPSIGLDLKAFAASIIEEEIENSKKSPEQIEKERLASELEQLRKEREDEKKQREKENFEKLQREKYDSYQKSINNALKTNGLPESDYLIKKTAEYMALAISEGIDVQPEDVIPLVKKDINGDLQDLFNKLSEDQIEEYVGKENLNRVRKKNLAKAKEKPVLPGNKIAKDVGNVKPAEKKQENKKVTLRELFDV